jgi:ADP-ribose pyrophosphatase YjhB (NUDIX family)
MNISNTKYQYICENKHLSINGISNESFFGKNNGCEPLQSHNNYHTYDNSSKYNSSNSQINHPTNHPTTTKYNKPIYSTNNYSYKKKYYKPVAGSTNTNYSSSFNKNNTLATTSSSSSSSHPYSYPQNSYLQQYCNNCGKYGHLFHQCKLPITSFGVVCYRKNKCAHNETVEYLMVRRKDSLGLVDFIRGKYSVYNKEYIMNMLKQMTVAEKEMICIHDFDYVWNHVWSNTTDHPLSKKTTIDEVHANVDTDTYTSYTPYIEANINSEMGVSSMDHSIVCDDTQLTYENNVCDLSNSNATTTTTTTSVTMMQQSDGIAVPTSATKQVYDQHKQEELISKEKFGILKQGVFSNGEFYTLLDLVKESNNYYVWEEAEWGFPKGRRNNLEKDFNCAVREFCEETGYNADKLVLIKNIMPFEEIFTGSNYKSYKHKYYVMYLNWEDSNEIKLFQETEIGECKWKTYEECIKCIRPYNLEKLRLLKNIHNTLHL